MIRKRPICSAVPYLALACLLLLQSCSDHENKTAASGSGTVALYVTDDISVYQQASISLNKVKLINSGTRQECTILESPLTIDVARLAGVMELARASDCPAGAYNRIQVEMNQDMYLADGSAFSSCTLSFFRDAGDVAKPLVCDPSTGLCSVDLATAVRRPSLDVLADQVNQLALDFDLKNFVVDNLGDPASCSVGMAMSSLLLSDIIERQDEESVSGRVAGLDTTARTFTLRSGQRPFTIYYGSISDAVQPGMDLLLRKAEAERLKIWVHTDDVDLEGRTVNATDISVRIEGTLSALDAATGSFLLTFRPPDHTVSVAYTPSTRLLTDLADQASIEAIVYAYDAATDRYQASIIAQNGRNGNGD